MNNRANEPPKTHFRTDRCYKTNDQWYFTTREGVEVGPYPTRKAAEFAVARLMKMLAGVQDPVAVRKIMREFMFLQGTGVRMP